MTLDEAIKHCLDIADGQDKCADISVSEHAKERISKCAADHRQLAEWLTELKEAKRLLKVAVKDFRTLGIMLEDKYGQCTAKKCCGECELGGGNLDADCQWRYEEEALKLIGEDGDTE